MGKEKKIVTLPIGDLKIFDSLAEIEWSNKNKKNPKNKEVFKEKIIQDLGKEAFLHSFTPSGEIGSGDTPKNNPSSENADLFIKEFYEIIGEEGKLKKLFELNSSPKKAKNNLKQFKMTVMALIKLYIETRTDLDESDKNEVSKEIDDYVKMFISALFFNRIYHLFLLDISEIEKIIQRHELIGISELDISKALKILKSNSNKKLFLKKTKSFCEEEI